MARSFEGGGINGPIDSQVYVLAVIVLAIFFILGPWIAGFAQRLIAWFGVWFENYANWAYKIASGQ